MQPESVLEKKRRNPFKKSPPRPEFEVQTWKEVEEQEEEKINQGRQKGNCQSFDRTSPAYKWYSDFLKTTTTISLKLIFVCGKV